ncbi:MULTISPECIES: hypothetical protein [unclassified Streptomyces]|uniref:hypothetical protein n=1 Tax=unclassified Streptomyces TaxID=2593676 RepID=UPI000445FA23|nr:hypothetical protein [Streptomyces sp. PCS3-D2]WKV73045.1 hypothetical protein AW27_016760 [Streptomyces sp. PCS3-D2]
MNSLSVSGHIEPDTRLRVTAFPDSSRPFVSLRIEGDTTEIALLAAPGSAEALRALSAAASEAAATLEALTAKAVEVAGHG